MSDRWELYPEVKQPEVRDLTWDDVLRLATADPATRQAVTMVERGDWTREQALIVLAFSSYNARRDAHHREVERLNTEIPDFIVTKDGKRYDRRK